MKKYVALILLLFYSLSLFAISRIPIRGKSSLPEKRILERRLKQEEIETLLSRGFTIVTLEYSEDCGRCLQIKQFLENKVNSPDYKPQTILEEINVQNLTRAKVRMLSANGDELLIDPSDQEIQQTFCKILINEPVDCAIQEI